MEWHQTGEWGWRAARGARGRVRRVGACVALALWLAPAVMGLPAATPVQAATITVCPSGPPACQYASIQAAVNAAAPGDTISIAAGTYTETLSINKSLTLTGAGAAGTIVDGYKSGTVLSVDAGATVAIGGLTIQDGYETSYYGGGGIYNRGTLTLTNSTVLSNSSCCNYSGGGGAIANYGTLAVTTSTVMSNSITGSPSSPGGGIYNQGTLTLTGSRLVGNSAGTNGGGIANSGTLTVTTSTVMSNSVTSGNGGGIGNSGMLRLITSTVSGNNATSGYGGGIVNDAQVTLAHSALSGNSAISGGGIDNSGTVTLTNSTLSGNSTNSTQYGDGGGILNDIGGTLRLTNSTFSGNTAAGPDGGGGILSYGGTVALTNSTLSGNAATGSGGHGGGIYITSGTLTLTNSTLAGNSASSGSGGGIFTTSLVSLTNTIVASNTAPSGPDCGGFPLTSGGYNLVGIGDGCGLTNGVNGDQVGSSSSPLNPLLGPLRNNGGPTRTMAELPGSPAINKVPLAHCPLHTDQRGQPRPDRRDHHVCDVGAYERQDG